MHAFSLKALSAIERTWRVAQETQNVCAKLFAEYMSFVPAIVEAGGSVYAQAKPEELLFEYVAWRSSILEGVGKVSSDTKASPLGEAVHVACKTHREAAILANQARQRYEEAWQTAREQFEKEEKETA